MLTAPSNLNANTRNSAVEDREYTHFLIKELSQNNTKPFTRIKILSILVPAFCGTILSGSTS
jgi:hypothetical protein